MPKLWRATAFVPILLLLTACPSTPNSPMKITPLGSTMPPIAISTQSIAVAQVQAPIQTNATRAALRTVEVPANRWVSLDRWSESRGLEAPKRSDNGWGPTFQSRTPNGVLSFTVGSRVAYWNGLAVALGFVPQLTNGLPFLHALDLIKNIAPLISLPVPQFRAKGTVVLDPGHGGNEAGAKSVLNLGYEKDYALDWAVRAKPILQSRGWTVLLTRSSDVEVPRLERVRIAERAEADLFISLHFNSVDSPSARSELSGLETYCLTPAGMPSNLIRDFKDDPASVFPNNGFDERNLQFAVRLHRALLQATGRNDRGIKRARFMTVLREQNRPAVLLEGGYLSHPEEARLIASAGYRQKLAEAVAKALE